MEYVVKNPIVGVKPPTPVKKEIQVFTEEEAARFVSTAKDDPHGLIFIFALSTGLRPEEYLGLQWPCLELIRETDKQGRLVEHGIVHIRRTVVWKKGGGWYFGEPKTKSSYRSVWFSASLYRRLTEHKKRQAEKRLKMGAEYQNNDLVFATRKGQPFNLSTITRRYFKPLLEQAKLATTFTLYSLRHSFVTLSLLAGVDDKVVSEQAGHSSVAFTKDIYAHVLPKMREGASDKLEKLLFSASGTQ